MLGGVKMGIWSRASRASWAVHGWVDGWCMGGWMGGAWLDDVVGVDKEKAMPPLKCSDTCTSPSHLEQI